MKKKRKNVDNEKRFYNNVANRVDANRAIFRERQIAFPASGNFRGDNYALSSRSLSAFFGCSTSSFPSCRRFYIYIHTFFSYHYSFAVFFRGQKRSFLRARHAFRVRTRLKEKGAEKMTSSTINLNKDQIRIQRNQQFVDSIIAYI